MKPFLMPSLGSDMEDAKLVEQLVAPGDTVHRGDVIGAVETQKGVIEIEVYQDGILDAWLVDLGTTVPVGAPLAMIREIGEDAEPERETVPQPETDTQPSKVEPAAPEPAAVPSETVSAVTPEPVPAPSETPAAAPVEPVPMPTGVETRRTRQRMTPAARRLAAERGIDPNTLTAETGATITRRDIEAAQPSRTPPATSDFRAAIAASMARSKREIPHYYLSHDVDLTAAEAFVAARNAGRAPSERLLIGAVCAKAVAMALAKYPEFNGHYVDDRFHPSDAVHLGFAINIRTGGLVAPALFNADRQSLDDLMQSLRDLTTRVRAGRFRARELSDATVTLTSLGERGTDVVLGVIYPPQSAIIGMGAPRLRPAVHDNAVVPRLMTTLTLSADHRVSDGSRGALLLRAIDSRLQQPETL